MIKKLAGSFALWLLFLSGLCALAFYQGSEMCLVCAVIWFLVPLLTFAANLYAGRQMTAAVSMPAAAGKNEKLTGHVTVNNKSFWPVAKIICRITVQNRLTLEETEKLLILSAAPMGETEIKFEIKSGYCGYLKARISGLWLLDWVGFLPVRCKAGADAEAKAAVLPDTFAPHVFLNLSATEWEDAEDWSQLFKGNDRTEVFSLRDYVPGDSLKQIHWKLSAKRGELIVREGSLPIEKSLLIFWDKNTREVSPAEMDAMAECTASVSQEIMNQGYLFTLGWTEGNQCVFEAIDTGEQLLQAIPRMLKYGPEISGSSGALSNVRPGARRRFGKALYIAGTVPEEFDAFSCTDMTLLLCGRQTAQTDWRTVFFSADTYQEDLDILEL